MSWAWKWHNYVIYEKTVIHKIPEKKSLFITLMAYLSLNLRFNFFKKDDFRKQIQHAQELRCNTSISIYYNQIILFPYNYKAPHRWHTKSSSFKLSSRYENSFSNKTPVQRPPYATINFIHKTCSPTPDRGNSVTLISTVYRTQLMHVNNNNTHDPMHFSFSTFSVIAVTLTCIDQILSFGLDLFNCSYYWLIKKMIIRTIWSIIY